MLKLKKLKYLISLVALFVIIYTLTSSKILSKALIEGLKICTNILIPSMFVFLIISEFFYKTRALNLILKPFNFLCEKFFKIDRNLGPVIFYSLICGYPSGANLIANLLKENVISKETANRMLYFCINSGPAFLIGGISIPLSNSITFGLILFISQTISFFVIGILTSFGAKLEKVNVKQKTFTISSALVSSVKNSVRNMAIICGFTLFFSAIISLIFSLDFLNINHNFYLKPIVAGFFEITNGVMQTMQINNINIFLLITFLTSFGGLCVHFQIFTIMSQIKISIKKFYLWRILYCLINLTAATFLFSKLTIPISTFLIKDTKNKVIIHSPIISICLIVLSISLLCCEKKIIIIRRKLKHKL